MLDNLGCLFVGIVGVGIAFAGILYLLREFVAFTKEYFE